MITWSLFSDSSRYFIFSLIDPLVKNGTFSCLVSNRYPKEPEEKGEKTAHKVYVVSLKEYEGITIPENAEFVRLIDL